MNPNVRFAVLVVVVVGVVVGVVYLLRPADSPSPSEAPLAASPALAGTPPVSHVETSFDVVDTDADSPDPAAPAQRDSRAPSRSGRGQIAGKVQDEGGKIAIAGATVRIERIDWEPGEDPTPDPLTSSTTTDDEGAFLFDRLPLGHYVALASKDHQARLDHAELTREEPEGNLTLKLRAAGPIAGRVVDTQGDPVPGAVVYPHHRETNSVQDHYRAAMLRGVTDDEGDFSLDDVQTGKWKLCVKADGYATLISDFLPVPGQGYTLTLGAGVGVSGHVIDAQSRNPVPGMKVVLSSEAGDRDRYTATSDDQGRFHLAQVRPDEYGVGLDSGTMVVVGGPLKAKVVEGRAASEIEVKVGVGGVIEGRVYDRDSGRGVAGAELNAYAEDGRGPARGEILTNGTGHYRITGLGEAQYNVMPRKTPGYGEPSWRERRLVSVKVGQTLPGVDFPVSRGVVVSGRVADASGRPVEGARVEGQAGMGADQQSARSEADGSFVLTGLSVTHEFHVRASKEGMASGQEGPMPLTEEGIHDLVLTLEPEGRIEGRVVDKAGRPVADAGVLAFPAGRFFFGLPEGRSDSQGRFEVKGLFTSAYKLTVAPPGSHSYNSSQSQQEVAVTAGQATTGITLVLYGDSGLTIEGRVTDANGKPIERANINASGMRAHHSQCESDKDGNYRVTGLAEGEYRLHVYHWKYTPTHMPGVAAGSRGVDFQLLGRGSIEGNVIDAATNRPVAEFEIMHTAQMVNALDPWMGQNFARMHHPEGYFVLKDVEAGNATVIVRAPGYAMAFQPVPNVPPDQTVTGVQVRLQAGSTLDGIVVDIAGRPVSSAMIFIGPVPHQHVREQAALTRSSGDGTFKLDSVAPDAGLVSAFHPGYATGTAPISPQAGRSQHVQIVLTQGGVIEGTVRLGKQPVPNQFISIHSPLAGGMPESAQTDANGTYRMAGVPPGEVMVNTTLRIGEGNTMGHRSQNRQATVEDGRVTVVDFDFAAADAAIEGYITRDGAPCQAFVNAVTAGASPTAGGAAENYGAQSDGQGFYRIDNMPSGIYRLNAGVPSATGGHAQRAVTVTVAAGKVTRCDIDMSGGAQVTGSVRGLRSGEQGSITALTGSVKLPNPLTMEALMPLSQSTVAATQIGPDGAFTLEGLEPGTYTLVAVAMPTGPPPDPTNPEEILSRMRLTSQEITIGESGAASVTLTLP